MLRTGITVFLDPVVHALLRYPESFGDLANLVTSICNLFYCLDLEFLCVAFNAHIKYILLALIVTLSGI